MNPKKFHRYFVLLFVATVAFSIFILRYASTWLTESSQELMLIRGEIAQLNQDQQDLDKAKKQLNNNALAIETLAMVLPSEKDQARVVEELNAIADLANVKIDSIGFPSSTLGSQSAPKPAAAAATTDTTTSSAQNSTSASTSSTAAPATKPTASVSQATPVKEIPGVQSIELSIGTITSKDQSIKGVRYDEMMRFIRLIERNRRTMQIRSIGIGQTESNGGEPSYNLTLSVVIFIQP